MGKDPANLDHRCGRSLNGPMTAAQQPTAGPVRAFQVMTKHIGPICNLDCKYCFYLEKEKLFPSSENFKMSDAGLETYVRQSINGQSVPEVSFAWQGGEPV